MSLQFVLGGSGTGKSTYVYESIIERAMKEEHKNFFILVPDQFTMQTQMDLVNKSPRNGILNIDVLSFSRLSHRIMEETGGDRYPVLDDTGKSLVLRKVAQNLKEEIPVLGSNLKKLGYVHEVKSAISEFMQYGIDKEKMQEMLHFSEKRGGLHGKLQDLGVLYQGFLKYTQDKFITTEETYTRLAGLLDKSLLIRESVVVMDGFTGFTPVQNQVIEKLLKLSDELIMTLTMDDTEENKMYDDGRLFSLSNKTIVTMEKLAKQAMVEIKPAIWMKQGGVRYKDAPAIAHLERNLFRYPYETFGEKTKEIQIYEAKNMETEVRHLCRNIRELLQEGYCYRDIAVIAGDLAAYSSLIEEIFEEYQIPVFLDKTREITLNPFIEYIRAALQVQVKQFSYETMFHYLRSGMVEIERETIDKLENYCLAFGIKGKKAWNSLFLSGNSKRKEWEEQELSDLNHARNEIMQSLSVFKTGKQKASKQIEQLYEFLVENECAKKLKEYEKYFAKTGDKSKEKEYAQIYRLVMELLEQMADLLGDEVLSWEEFSQILDAGFGEIQVGMIPQSVDQIVVGDMERTRLKQVKALFFLGVNDGKIPKQSGGGGIISDIDREFLAEGDFELSPTPRQQLFIQKFYLYLNVTKPSHRLYLSYAGQNMDGKSMKPSYFISGIQKLFPDLEIKTEESNTDTFFTKEEGRMALAKMLEQYKRGELEEQKEAVLMALLKVFQETTKGKQWIEDILNGVFLSYEGGKISKEAAKILYGSLIQSSVSRLEKMASCAYAHFLQYGLGLEERQEYSFEAVDMGNVFHGVLEMFAGKLAQENYNWMNFPEEAGERILKEALQNYAINYENTVLFSSARNAYMLEKIERILLRSVRTLQYQLQKGKFLPKNFEISFSSMEDLDAIRISLNEEEKMYLQGRIDRVDTYEEEQNLYVKVVDYKSSEQQFQLAALYYGLQLQLVVYLNAAMELKKKQHPEKKVLPGAFVYYHVFDPMVEGREKITPQEIDDEIKKQLKVTGIVNSDPVVLKGLDTSNETKSDVIPVEYKKDGSLSSRSSVMTEEEIDRLQMYAGKKIKELGEKIAGGNIAISPISFKQKESCTFCKFKDICEFDARIPGFEKKKLEDMPQEEVWKKIREATEK